MGMAPCVSGRLSCQEGFSRGMVVKKPCGSHAIFGEHESDLGLQEEASDGSDLCFFWTLLPSFLCSGLHARAAEKPLCMNDTEWMRGQGLRATMRCAVEGLFLPAGDRAGAAELF